MKYFLSIWILGFYFSSSAQSHFNSPFLGDWVWNNNSQSFVVHLYEEGTIIKGDYILTEEDNKKVIYKSNKLIDKEYKLFFGHALHGHSDNGKTVVGNIKDNVLLGDHIHTIKHGELLLTLKSTDSLLWKVTPLNIYNRRKKMKVPENFTIPTDIILIRQKK